jgi:MarR family transcriptional regulator, organic hydroperoxide resistance regulator
MDTNVYVDKISALFSKIMLDPMDLRLPQEVSDIEITSSQLQGLIYILRHQGTSIGDLAEGLSISHPAAVKLVSRLERKSLVAREESEQDRRVSYVRLTELGKVLTEKTQSTRLEILARATSQMNEQELEGLMRGLEALFSATLASQSTVEKACLRCGNSHIGCCPVNRAHAAITGTGVEKT